MRQCQTRESLGRWFDCGAWKKPSKVFVGARALSLLFIPSRIWLRVGQALETGELNRLSRICDATRFQSNVGILFCPLPRSIATVSNLFRWSERVRTNVAWVIVAPTCTRRWLMRGNNECVACPIL